MGADTNSNTGRKGSNTKVAIIGGTGYGGAELIRLLNSHPDVQLSRVTSIDHVDEPLEAVHLNLSSTGLTFENIPPVDAVKGMDVVFLALPHKVSATLAPQLAGAEARIIDLSGDFRLESAGEYESFYGGAHPHPDELGRWTYGLPELQREAIVDARRVASPGCFATTIALGLLPLADKGEIAGAIQTVACTGSSGSGAYAGPGTHHPVRANNLQGYKPLRHQHTPEIEQTLRKAAPGGRLECSLNFVPVSAPLTRGILAQSFVSVPGDAELAELHQLFAEYYASAPFVRVLPAGGRTASVVAVKGSMYVDLSLALGPACAGRRQLLISTAADNLVKGGAGQAVQSMNIMLGLEETSGIGAPALWP